MELGLGIRLCVQCQQDLETTIDRGRLTCRCPLCNDMTLASEWTEVIQNHYQAGGYNPEITHRRFEELLPPDRVDLRAWSW